MEKLSAIVFRSAVWVSLVILPAFLISCAHLETPTYSQELNYGISSAQMGLWNEARFRFQNLVTKHPDNPIAHNNLAVAFEALGQFEEAEKEYVRALELDPDNAVTRENYERLSLILKEKVKN